MRSVLYKFISLLIGVFVLLANISSVFATIYPENSVLSSGKWYSIRISADGVYKLTYSDFLSMGFTQEEIDWDNLAIFGNGGMAIEERTAYYKQSDLRENAIYVNKSGNYALFYAKGTTKVVFDNNTSSFSFSTNPYSDFATYFVTFDANIGEKKRIESKSSSSSYDTVLGEAKDYFLYKRELNNLIESGDLWVGERMTPSTPLLSIPVSLPNISSLEKTKISISLASASNISAAFGLNINGTNLRNLTLNSTGNSDPVAYMADRTFDTLLTSANNTFNITYNYTNTSDKAYLNYILATYNKNLVFNNSYLRFYSTLTGYTTRYNISNIMSQNVMVWDVTDINNVFALEDTQIENNTLSFNVENDTIRTIVVVAGSSFQTPTLLSVVENQNLHSMQATDFVIVTHKDFIQQANQLAEYHRLYDSISVEVVEVDKIYNEFSSGQKDFLAIREFLRMLYNKYKDGGKNPKNVLLFGDGTYDNKNILGYNNNFIPTYQSKGYYNNPNRTFTSDDVLACLSDYTRNETNDTLFIGVGRLCVNSTLEAEEVIDKCKRYMTKADLLTEEDGDWRNFVMLTSDDADNLGELYFIRNAENIYKQIDATQPYLNIQKVYEDAYKEYTSSSGATYPDATSTIDDRMNKGCLLFNYLGHGSYDHLSSERLITKTNISSWNNYNKLPLMITSTCEFARFDLADKQSAGEAIVSSTQGAGIALIAAARKIASNDGINRNLHKFALLRKDNGEPYTFGEVKMQAKNNTYLQLSERSISLIGDPALKISLPKYNVKTLQINNSLYDESTQSFTTLDTARALSNIYIRGEIVDFDNKKVSDFNGKIKIYLFDKKAYYYTLDNAGLDTNLRFEQQNNILHKGSTNVENGEFEYSFIVPKDIAYNYGRAKISYYAQDSNIDAAGYTDDFILGGIDTSVELMVSRPEVNLYINDSNFVSGGITDENPNLYAVIWDSIPINIAGAGLGHDIVARLDNAANTFILNDYYTADKEDINKGYISYPFSNLSEGEHTLSIKVWNIYNYSSQATITFRVVNSEQEEYEAYNYPNPFRESTNIMVKFNKQDWIRKANIKIFNAQGKIVKTIDASNYIGSNNVGPINWDGTLDSGGRIGNGIYYYTIELTDYNGDTITKTNKMLVIK
ncbi:MAG: type IX secretion system sortase PorU [Bacteroidota bacterium]|nr:type IX secretion system sortase PorU [Bacteroidota bacterium]